MPRVVRDRLNSALVRRTATPGRHHDGGGLYLVVSEARDDATGRRARWWVWRGTVQGKRRELGLGSAELLPLKAARELAREYRRVAREGGDPTTLRRKSAIPTFEAAAREVWAAQIEGHARNPRHAAQWLGSLEAYAFPVIGSRSVDAVDQGEVLRVLAPIWTEKPETARRVRQRLRTVFAWARTAGHRTAPNPVDDVELGLARQKRVTGHHTALNWKELPGVLRRIEATGGTGALALRFTILTAARSGEVRGATWKEIDLEAGVWAIPAGRMKAGRPHRVPLTAAVLEALRLPVADPDALVFPAARRRDGTVPPLSDMTLAAVLKRLDVRVAADGTLETREGEGRVATVHGMRSTFRDWAEEAVSFPHEVKEAALAHAVGNKVEAAYRRTDLFDRRREMMDAWARWATAGGAAVVKLADHHG